jgi:hypothetical protein
MLAIAFYAGEYTGDPSALTYMCDIEGSVTPGGGRLLQRWKRLSECCKCAQSDTPHRR